MQMSFRSSTASPASLYLYSGVLPQINGRLVKLSENHGIPPEVFDHEELLT
jgi:hypothetical protein